MIMNRQTCPKTQSAAYPLSTPAPNPHKRQPGTKIVGLGSSFRTPTDHRTPSSHKPQSSPPDTPPAVVVYHRSVHGDDPGPLGGQRHVGVARVLGIQMAPAGVELVNQLALRLLVGLARVQILTW